ncbi:MAG TPA: hypothetical protein VGD22_17490 [Sphingobacteriaceae bacterium]
MKIALILSFSMFFFLNSNGQDRKLLPETKNEWKMWKKRQKYKMTVWKYSHKIYMKDGSTLNSNSKIFFDSLTNKTYLYYSSDDSLRKIYPEETTRISRINPYKKDQQIDGLPAEKRWKFQVISGKINGYSSFTNSTQPEEFSIGLNGYQPITSEILVNLLMPYEEIYQLYLKKEYYQAIVLYNKKNKKSQSIPL